MKKRVPFLAAAVAVAVAPLLRAADVPIKQVVLFSSGVGYFEHDGPIKDNDTTELRFKAGQINDVLKSLVLQDTGNGHVGVITYPSQDPVDRALKSFEIDITQNPSMAQLLNQLRGAKVTLTANTESISGTILGVETKRKPVEKGEPVEVAVLNVLAGASIRSIDMDTIHGLSLDDAQLQSELQKALTTLAQSRDKDKKPMTINFQGSGQREVRIGYVVETPIWKTSYRLILPDSANQDTAAKPRLQGWAIIENQTDNDWNNVDLSLVSGRPISFVMNLYSPLYIPRPVVTPELYASLRPQTYAEGLAEEAESAPKADAAAAMPAPMPGLAQQFAANRALKSELADRAGAAGGVTMLGRAVSQMDANSSVSTVANATNLGDLFEYKIGSVTLARQNSAMIPIVTDDIEAERVSIYNSAVLPRNPLTGAKIKNSTGKSLLQGPITVLDKGVYAGDAQIQDLPPGQQRLLSYGIDLQMTVDTPNNQNSNDILGGKIVKGVLQVTRKNVSSVEYVSNNKGDVDKALIIEHPFQNGWDLIDSPKPEEITPTVYRFRVSVAKHAVAKTTIKTQTINSETIEILPADLNALIEWNRQGAIPKDVRDALAKAIEMRQAVVDCDRQMEETKQKIDAITAEQGRIRDNMKSVDHNSAYFQRLLSKLNDQESQIEKLQTSRDDATQKREAARKTLEDYLGSLNVG